MCCSAWQSAFDTLRQTTEFIQLPTFWVDSRIVLHWIKSKSNVWKVFVSNRIAEIQRLTKDCTWRHVPSEQNPADPISRGMIASQILEDKLWHGPYFLLMAPLPSVRISPARPFIHSGMDYCGPFFVRPLSGRGAPVKIYVALFVCLVVKAVHIEVVADLSSVACINAVKRFVARHGRVLELHCDNATAFVGAHRELRTT